MSPRARLLAAAAAAALCLAAPAAALPALDAEESTRYTILSQEVTDVLRAFGAGLGVPMTIDAAVSGRVTNLDGSFTPRGFLDRLAAENGLAWYHDGASIHVTPVSANRSVLVDFAKVSPGLLQSTIEEMGVADPRFAIRATQSDGIGVLTGPPRYIELVERAFAILEARIPAPGAPAAVPAPPSRIMIIRGDSQQVWRGKNAVSEGPVLNAIARPDPAPIAPEDALPPG